MAIHSKGRGRLGSSARAALSAMVLLRIGHVVFVIGVDPIALGEEVSIGIVAAVKNCA